MKVKLIQCPSTYDIDDEQQYRVEVRQFIFWNDVGGLYAKNFDEAWKKVPTFKGLRRKQRVVGVKEVKIETASE